MFLRMLAGLAFILVGAAMLGISSLLLELGRAVWLCMDRYGWTPHGLAAAFAGSLALLCGLVYQWSAALRWPAGVRQPNPVLGVAAILLAAIWLLSGPSPEGVSARSIEARALEGHAYAEALWDVWHGLGRPGQAPRAWGSFGPEIARSSPVP